MEKLSMKPDKKNEILIGRINETIQELQRISYRLKEVKITTKNWQSAIVLGKLFENYYTVIETIFLKISQFFENDLVAEHWHKDLLDKMKLKINNIREPVISYKTYLILREFLQFRHFYRYYVDTDYDWDKIDFLKNKFSKLNPLIEKDLNDFVVFLRSLY